MSDCKIYAKIIEEKANNQIQTLISQPAFSSAKIRIMPDVHAGAGCVIGFTADMGDKIIPNIVGVDIGCGMLVAKLKQKASEINFAEVDEAIHRYVPAGFGIHEKPVMTMPIIKTLLCYDDLQNHERFEASIGTLGGGNHFIEIDRDDYDDAYLVIHTGSRNLGKQVCMYYQKLAEELSVNIGRAVNDAVDMLKKAHKEQDIQTEVEKLKAELREKVVPKELSYLTGGSRYEYLHDMDICQRYACANRITILDRIIEHTSLDYDENECFETVHNYISFDDNIIRKGAVRANAGERLIIPMNMRDGSLICIGKGNPDWNCSAPHGAGRIMSRAQAKRDLTMEEYKNSMDGIFTTSVDGSTLDEAPMAYKPMEAIVDCIGDTVEIEKVIKPIYNFKAAE